MFRMSQFEYVMVLISIIIGIAVAHLLLGVGGIIDRFTARKERLELSVAYLAWLIATFGWLILFWWWQFRLTELVVEWTVQLYFFLVLYAVTLFLICVVLVPRSWDGVNSLKDYFLERRVWFYGLCIIGSAIDLVDAYLKGGVDYIAGLGPMSWAIMITSTLVAILGMKIRNIMFHNIAAVTIMLWQYLIGFDVFPQLAI
jgi:hypothetical protein